MSSFVNVFGGGLIQPSFSFYSSIDLNSNIELAWATDFGNNPIVVSSIMDIYPAENGYTIKMPNATNVSVGFSFSINNKTAFSFTLLSNDGVTPISVIQSQSFNEFYLTDNTTVNGSWTLIPSLGTSAVTSIGLVSIGGADGNIVVTSNTTNPITLGGTFSIDLAGDIGSIAGLGNDIGIAIRKAPGVWATGSISGAANQISITNGDGVDGNPEISLAQDITGISSITLIGGNLSFGVPPNVIAATNVDGGIEFRSIGSGSLSLSATGTGSILLQTVSGLIAANSDIILTGQHGVLFGDATSDTLKIVAPANISTSYTVRLPGSIPNVNQCLGVTSVSGTIVDSDWLNIPNITGATITNTIPYFIDTTGGSASTTMTVTGDDGFGHPTGLTISGTAIVGNVSISANTLSTLAGDIILSPVSPRSVLINANTQIQSGSQIRFYNAANSFYYSLNAQPTLASNYIAQLPLNNGTSGGILSTDGLNPATLIWTNALTNLTSASFGAGNIDITPTSISFGTGISITSTTISNATGDIILSPVPSSFVSIDASAKILGGNQVRFYNSSSNFYYAFSSQSVLSANYVSQLPLNNGTSGGVLSTDGLNPATLIWTNALTNLTSASFGVGNISITPTSISFGTGISINPTTISNVTSIAFSGSGITISPTAIQNIGTASFGSGNISITTTSVKTTGANPLVLGVNSGTALTIDTSQNITTALDVTVGRNLSVTGKVSTAPGVASSNLNTVPGTFVLGTPYQNTFGYDVMLVSYIRVTAGSPTITFSTSPTSITTGESFAGSTNQLYTIPLYLPKNYYAYVQAAGGTSSLIMAQVIPI